MNFGKLIKTLIKILFGKSSLKRSNLNPHKDIEAIKSAYSRCYNENSMDYETFYNDLEYVSPGIHLENYYNQCIELLKNNESWLDVGCGSGNILKKAISDKDIELHGMDIVRKSVDNAIENGINCIKNSVSEKYPYEDETFHLVTATDVLEHLHKNDVNSALTEIYRVLKKDHYAMLAPSTKPDMTGYFHLTVESKDWWLDQCNKVGFIFVEYIGEYGIIFKK